MRPAVARRLGAFVIALGLLASLAVSPVLAASIVVNSTADTAADDGVCSLREAIAAATTDTASGVSAGECGAGSGADAITFTASGTITLGSALPSITSDVSITGAGAITISGNSLYRVLAVTGGTVTLSGLTITAGAATDAAGILNNGGALTVTNSTISANTAAIYGGGIYNVAGPLTVMDSTVSGNRAFFGGGGIYSSAIANVIGSTISLNSSTDFSGIGGGIYSADGALFVTNSTISENTAIQGGGIASIETTIVINSTLNGNTAHSGGGIMAGGVLTVVNSTITGNTAGNGGGLYNLGTVALTGATVSGNAASLSGGGITAAGTESLVNTIVAGNTAPIGPDFEDTVETTTTSVVGVPVGKTLADVFVPAGLANNGGPTQTIALALVAGNPAIDTATSAVCAAAPVISGLDQRGVARPAPCDIGAYEAEAPSVAAHANVAVTATSAGGAVVTFTAPVGTDEQAGVAGVACLPASGSTFVIGTTTVTCTATDQVGHTATGTFQVQVDVFGPPPTTPPTDATAATVTTGTPGFSLSLGLVLVAVFALLRVVTRRRPR